ncbi:hypothetical protein GIX45_10730 [Erwinia sp. CPCC 100877]|nr:hypothetical protein [Erwinia sp. CPCC 100877]
MDAIEKIVEQIINKGQQEAAEFKQKEKRRIDQEMKQQETAVIVQEKELIKRNEQQLNKLFRQKQNRQRLDIRQATLQKKQTYLEQLFSEAVEQLNTWTEVEFQGFAERVLKRLSLTGEATMILGEYSKELFSADWLLQHAPEQTRVTLSEKFITGEGGFIIAQAGIDYNFLFSSLIEEVKTAAGFQIAEALFSE